MTRRPPADPILSRAGPFLPVERQLGERWHLTTLVLSAALSPDRTARSCSGRRCGVGEMDNETILPKNIAG